LAEILKQLRQIGLGDADAGVADLDVDPVAGGLLVAMPPIT
jgi:hypothetical protein